MNPITIPNITIPVIGLPAIGIPSVGFPSASGGGLAWPAGLKESIKAIYDPAKQGMTNYDVIEAYVEDFTTWHYLSSRGTATVTTNKIIITKSFSNIQNIIEDNKSPYDDIKIYVTGISKDNPLTVNQYVDNKWVRLHTYTTDGIYIIKNRNLYVGFGTYITDNCNITITQLPTSILQDLSGNGNHAYLYGGKGKLNSGMGLYKVDFTSWRFYPSFNTVEYYHNKLVIKKAPDTKNLCAHTFTDKFTAKISNIPDGTNLYYKYYDRINKKNVSILLHNGINEIDYTNADGSIAATNMFIISKDVDFNITIEQIPDCPDQLCYDGKMYAVCYGFPILTDYTVMADRTWFDNEGNRVFITKGNIWPNCAFNFEKVNASLSSETFSYSQSTNIDDLIGKSGITYQTKQSYNGKVIGVGTSSDGDILLIGGQLKGEYVGCHGKIIIADRSFTEDEITWLKDNWKKI
jgi:hypothetical protein|nr:MAG TPA: hypothetical protein [Caudoviricetes sp.]